MSSRLLTRGKYYISGNDLLACLIVLEARNRTGGRINTETMGSTKVDMGASWIHGIGPGLGDDPKYLGKNNPIYTIAQDNKIATY